jgi:hypothetical protein
MAEIPYQGDGGPQTHHLIETYRQALNLYKADVFDECASVCRETIKTNPPIYYKCTFLTMLCVVTEHWLRAERYRLHAEALWKLLDNNKSNHHISWSSMNATRRELNHAYLWCKDGKPDDPVADAEGVEEYWEEWGGKILKEDFDTSAVGIAPPGMISGVSEDISGASMATQAGSDTTIIQGENSDVLDQPPYKILPPRYCHIRSQSDPAPSNIRWPFSLLDNKESLDPDNGEEAAPSNID